MTNHQSPITPPSKLFKQWEDDILNERDNVDYVLDCAWRNGFQAGADQELEACCKMLEYNFMPDSSSLRAARRPKPPSLKEQALDDLHIAFDGGCLSEGQADTIRRALEQLND
jgi:hypothetical protein